MSRETIDSNLIGKNESINPRNWIALGVFLYVSISSFLVSTRLIIRDLLIHLNVYDGVIFWLLEVVELALILVILLILIRKYRIARLARNSNVLKFIFFCISLLIITQAFQFLYTLYIGDIWGQEFIMKMGSYYKNINGEHHWKVIRSLLEYFKYAIFGLVLIRK